MSKYCERCSQLLELKYVLPTECVMGFWFGGAFAILVILLLLNMLVVHVFGKQFEGYSLLLIPFVLLGGALLRYRYTYKRWQAERVKAKVGA